MGSNSISGTSNGSRATRAVALVGPAGTGKTSLAEALLFASGAIPAPAADDTMSTRDVQKALKTLGWPIAVDGSWGDDTFKAAKDFQRGFAFWQLLVDGHAGPKTQEAFSRFDVLERRVDMAEGHADALALGAPQKTLDEEIAELKTSDKVEADLAALKAKMSKEG